eukprot:5051693-Amphidinium_carterae.1
MDFEKQLTVSSLGPGVEAQVEQEDDEERRVEATWVKIRMCCLVAEHGEANLSQEEPARLRDENARLAFKLRGSGRQGLIWRSTELEQVDIKHVDMHAQKAENLTKFFGRLVLSWIDS